MNLQRELSVDCRGKCASVEMLGSGPDVMFVGAAAPMMWSRPAARSLADKGYRVINFDYGTGAPEPEPRTALGQVSDVFDVMEATGAKDVALVGLSRGAITAYAVASRSRAVRELVLAFPVAGFADTIHLVEPEPAPRSGETEEQFLRRSLEMVFSEDFLDSHLDSAVNLAGAQPGEVERVSRADEDPFPAAMTVSVPTLVIEGGRDRVVSSIHPARYLTGILGSEHVMVADARHGWLMEDPEAFATILADYFARLGRFSALRP